MTAIRSYISMEETKPGARYHVLRDQQRKQGQLNKYLSSCQLYKRVNPKCDPKKSAIIQAMYQEKKVMKNRTCRRQGAKEFNFKKQSANQIISKTKFPHKENKFGPKHIAKREFQHYDLQESDQE